jgi:hypothetical protein
MRSDPDLEKSGGHFDDLNLLLWLTDMMIGRRTYCYDSSRKSAGSTYHDDWFEVPVSVCNLTASYYLLILQIHVFAFKDIRMISTISLIKC